MLFEPPYQINNSFPGPSLPPRWRHMKHTCSENPSMSYFGNAGVRSIDPVLTTQGLRCKQNEHDLGIPRSVRSAWTYMHPAPLFLRTTPLFDDVPFPLTKPSHACFFEARLISWNSAGRRKSCGERKKEVERHH
ncbi:hypothetical protein EDD85DRAFT_127359 [Armillaria nabsnona]|nr:hypothetical protein EDD85DRAFT_127359 [Armillaria nabsnona]